MSHTVSGAALVFRLVEVLALGAAFLVVVDAFFVVEALGLAAVVDFFGAAAFFGLVSLGFYNGQS